MRERHILRNLLYLTIVTGIAASAAMARYTSSISGTGSLSIAAFEPGVNVSALDVSSLSPGERMESEIRITNFRTREDGSEAVSDVTQSYGISVRTTGNLPLEFSLAPGSSGGKGSCIGNGETIFMQAETTSEGIYTVYAAVGADGSRKGVIPYEEPATHSYTLTVSWDGDRRETGLSEEIDSIVLAVDVEPYQE